MKITVKNEHHTEIGTDCGTIAVNTSEGIRIQINNGVDESFIDLERAEAQELVKLLEEALQDGKTEND
jgi:hypothetical protein